MTSYSDTKKIKKKGEHKHILLELPSVACGDGC